MGKIDESINLLKWQIKNRMPGGGFYERAFQKDFNEDFVTSNSVRYYLYLLDLYESRMARYLLGSYFISKEKIDGFFEFLDKWYEYDGNYSFSNVRNFYLPKPFDKDKKLYRTELFDLVLPYLVDYPNLKAPFHEGPYEYGHVKINGDDVVLDCGASFGMFSAYASSKGANVYAFEPTKYMIDNYLNKTKELNDDITIINKAVSDSLGKEPFVVDVNNSACNGLHKAKSNMPGHKHKFELVESITIDDFVEKYELKKVDFIKADIEGAERLLLKGARKTLMNFQPKLAICAYHKLDDLKTLKKLILDANPNYKIETNWKKIYAHVPEKHKTLEKKKKENKA